MVSSYLNHRHHGNSSGLLKLACVTMGIEESLQKYGVYAAIAIAGILSLIIIGLQCQIIYLQR